MALSFEFKFLNVERTVFVNLRCAWAGPSVGYIEALPGRLGSDQSEARDAAAGSSLCWAGAASLWALLGSQLLPPEKHQWLVCRAGSPVLTGNLESVTGLTGQQGPLETT